MVTEKQQKCAYFLWITVLFDIEDGNMATTQRNLPNNKAAQDVNRDNIKKHLCHTKYIMHTFCMQFSSLP